MNKESNEKKVFTQREFKAELEKTTPANAINNIRGLMGLALKSGIIDNINKALILEKSFEVLENLFVENESLKQELEEIKKQVPIGLNGNSTTVVPEGMQVTEQEKTQMIH